MDDRTVLEAMEACLSAAASKRDRRPLDLSRPDDSGWVLHERLVMLKAVNEHRVQIGLQPVPIEKIRQAEQTSKGHVDYQHKFALACRDLVFEETVDES